MKLKQIPLNFEPRRDDIEAYARYWMNEQLKIRGDNTNDFGDICNYLHRNSTITLSVDPLNGHFLTHTEF